MNKYQIDFSSDGCPNDCSYCRDMGLGCVYRDNKPLKCERCGKPINDYEAYELKIKSGLYVTLCEDCFGKVVGNE